MWLRDFFGWHQRTESDLVGESHKESQGLCNGSGCLGRQEVGVPAEAGKSCQNRHQGSLHNGWDRQPLRGRPF